MSNNLLISAIRHALDLRGYDVVTVERKTLGGMRVVATDGIVQKSVDLADEDVSMPPTRRSIDEIANKLEAVFGRIVRVNPRLEIELPWGICVKIKAAA